MTRQDEGLEDVLETLSILTPGAADAPRPAAQALIRLRQQIVSRPLQTRFFEFFGRFNLMLKRSSALATMVVLLFFAAAFTFPTVRAAASDFLGIFRVQKFAPISISPAQLALLEELAGQGLYPGEFEMLSEPGTSRSVNSVEEAAGITGLPVRGLPGMSPDHIYVSESGSGRLTINLANMRAILNAAGADPMLLPDSLHGTAVDVTVFAGVHQFYQGNGVNLLQTESPQIDYPADVDPAVIGEALLQLLGMAPGEARRLAQNIDWSNTLLLPIPTELATYSEVRVDGVSGLAISSLQGGDNALMWQKDGIVYMLNGHSDMTQLIRMANSLR